MHQRIDSTDFPPSQMLAPSILVCPAPLLTTAPRRSFASQECRTVAISYASYHVETYSDETYLGILYAEPPLGDLLLSLSTALRCRSYLERG